MVSPNISKPPFVSLKLEGCAASVPYCLHFNYR